MVSQEYNKNNFDYYDKISRKETQILIEEDPVLVKIYTVGMKPNMDFSTGLVGTVKEITPKYLSTICSIEKIPGRSSVKISIQKVRDCIKRMQRIGLIKIHPNNVYECLLSILDSNCTEKEQKTQNRFPRGFPEVSQRFPEKSVDKPLIIKDKKNRFPRGFPEVSQRFPIYNNHYYNHYNNHYNIYTYNFENYSCVYPVDNFNVQYLNSANKNKKTGKINQQAKKYTDPDFIKFWAEYPVHTTKHETYEFWIKNKLSSEITAIMEDINWRKINDQHWSNGYHLDPIRYVKRRRWEDDKMKMEVKNGNENQISGTHSGPGFSGNSRKLSPLSYLAKRLEESKNRGK